MTENALARSLRLRHIAMISIGGVVGAGFFIGASTPISVAGPGALLSYALAGLMTFLVNLMLRDIALRAPGHGSFVNQIRHALGGHAGFMTGWTYWLVWVTTLAIEIMAAAALLAPLVHLPFGAVEVIILTTMTAANLMAVQAYGEMEYWFAMLKIAAIALFIMIGLAAVFHGDGAIHQSFASPAGLVPHGWMALLAVIPAIVFSMSGSEVVTIAALESDAPDRNIAKATRAVALRVVGFYLCSVALILCLVPWSQIVPGESPFLLVLNRLHVPFASAAMEVVIVSAMLSTLNSGLYATSRVLFELADVDDAPAQFMRLDPRTQAPRIAVLFSAAAALAISAIAIASPNTVFAFLLSATGALIIFHNALIVLTRIRLCGMGATPLLTLVLLMGALVAMAMVAHTRHELALSTVTMMLTGCVALLRHLMGRAPRRVCSLSRPGR
ncbi:amino acid permease [Asaia krungthepensis]|uniref:Amino acid ABC transporter n=1 Tax=Asaia krungthepensis NRIC 0535 TaxID=1307925 RepID=A0ABQ0PVH5_9PROT|nr:amino acid permease [Asaia krungthepensis]GBQ82629.1 amino acid ABC transporter [Asaia krungthepensis NRIC 0535]